MYQKPIDNFKLECVADESKSMSKWIRLFDDVKKEQDWYKLDEQFRQLGNPCLLVLCACLFFGTFWFTSIKPLILCIPIAFISVMGMFITILAGNIWSVHGKLVEGSISEGLPSWTSDCLDAGVGGLEQPVKNISELEEVASELQTLCILMITYIVMLVVPLALVLLKYFSEMGVEACGDIVKENLA